MPKLLLRPSGISLLVGLIDLQPGSFEYYINALKPILKDWGKPWRRRFKEDSHQLPERFYNLDHFYQTCGFVGLGAWDLVTLTLMSEKGLANHLSFMGHVRGQSYFHAQDFSLVLDGSHQYGDRVRGCMIRLAEMTRELGLTSIVKLPGERDRVEWGALEGESFTQRALTDRDAHYYARWNSLNLNQINCGKDRSNFWGYDSEETVSVTDDREKELVGLYQLKLNQVAWMRRFEWLHTLAFLTILTAAYREKKRQECSEDPSRVFPDVLRPMFCDGYFDLFLLMRSPYLTAMESFVQTIKYLTIDEAFELLEKQGLGGLMAYHEEIGHEPLFELSHSTVAFSYGLQCKAREHAGRVQVTPQHSRDLLAGDAENRDILPKILRDYRQTFRCFNHPDGIAESKEKIFQIRPSTLISANAGKLVRSIEEIGRIRNLASQGAKPLFGLSKHLSIFYGSFDFELFQKHKPCFFGDFLAEHQMIKHLLLRFKHMGGHDHSGALFRERTYSPLLSMFSQLGPPLDKGLLKNVAISDRMPDRLAPEQSLCLLSITHLDDLLTQLIERVATNAWEDSEMWEHLGKNYLYWQEEFDRVSHEVAAAPNDQRPEMANILLQHSFNRFLKDRFADFVSFETLESLFTTICAVDGSLSDPMRFDLVLDVARYLRQILASLMTIYTIPPKYPGNGCDPDPEGDPFVMTPGSFRYYDLDTNSIKVERVTNDAKAHEWVGVENYLLEAIDLTHRIVAQRTQGSFPYHDRSYARISDLRTFHTKKLVSISWMVNCTIQTVNQFVQTRFEAFTEGPLGRLMGLCCDQPKDKDEVILPGMRYLAGFSNSPEVAIKLKEGSVSLNARLLTSVGSMVMIYHEIGHLYSRSLGLDRKDEATGFHLDYHWDEVCADLFARKMCFAQLEAFGLEEMIPRDGLSWSVTRIDGFSDRKEVYDRVDLTMLAWIFQLLQMPKTYREHHFLWVLQRLHLDVLILKTFLYLHITGESWIDSRQTLFQKVYPAIHVFFQEKLPAFLDYLREGIDKGAVHIGDSRNFNLESSLWQHYFSGDTPEIEEIGYSMTLFCMDRFQTLRDGIFQGSMFYRFLAFLAMPVEVEVPMTSTETSVPFHCPSFLQPMIWDGVNSKTRSRELHQLLEGILERRGRYTKAENFFAAAAQLVGLINLSFCGNGSSHTIFFNGYPGFAHCRDQQNLARLRQLATMLIQQGGAMAMDEYLERHGYWGRPTRWKGTLFKAGSEDDKVKTPVHQSHPAADPMPPRLPHASN
ncbi:MAG: hypothetical protein QNK37_30145 [Acidobacteriota bacterium]|nr:hypothetical protein [Acidobacteriota bacterium]